MRHAFTARQIPEQAGIEIAGAGAHRDPGGRGETHAGVHGFAVAHRRQAGAIAEMGEDDASLRRFRSGQAGQFFHEKRIRQAVKPIAPHPLRFIAARDRQQPGHARQVMVKSRVETRHLGQVGKPAMKRLGQQDLLRQMLGIEGAEPVQLLNHFRGDALRLAVLRPAMHHAMPHRGQGFTPAAFLDPIHQSAHRRRVIRRRHRARKVVRQVRALHPQGGLRQPIRSIGALQDPSERGAGLEQRELDARRAAVDGQDACDSFFHR